MSKIKTGSSIYIDDSVKAPLINFELDGKTEQDAEPSPDYPSELKSVGYKNYFSGLTKGVLINPSNGNPQSFSTAASSDYIYIDLNYNYYLDGITNNLYSFIAFYDENKNYISRTNADAYSYTSIYKGLPLNNGTFLNDNAKYIRFTTYENPSVSGNIDDVDNLQIQLSKGDEHKSYIPYGKYGVEVVSHDDNNNSSTTLFTLNEPLRNWDRLYYENGKVYIERGTGKVIFDGSETTWIQDLISGQIYYYINLSNSIDIINHDDRIKIFSNYFTPKNSNTIDGFYQNRHNLVIFNHGIATTLTDFKTWLSTHNTEVQYQLATPIIEDLGYIDMPTTYSEKTYIDTTDELEPIMSLEYINDFSTQDKIALRNNTAAIKSKIIVKATDDEEEIELTENNSIKDWEYTDERLVPGKGFLGQFVARTLSGNLQDVSEDFSIEGREVELQLGVYRMNDRVTTWYTFGNFLITDPENDEVKDNTSFEAMDYTKLFNQEFNGNYVDEEFTTSYNDLVGFGLSEEQQETFIPTPVSMLWIARYACKQVGVTLATTNFVNNDFTVTINPFQAKETCRDVIKAIAQLAFTWARIGWDNRLYLDFEQKETTEIDTLDILDNNQYFGLTTKKEMFGPVDGIGFGLTKIDGETAIEHDPSGTGSHTLYFYDNPFLVTFDERLQIAKTGSVLYGLTYIQLETETIGHPWFNGTQLINVKDMENADNITYPLSNIIKYSGHIRSEISSMDESEIEETLGYTDELVRELRDATIQVDKQNGVITSTSRTVKEIQDDMDNYYTKQEINELIEDAEGLTNRYTTSGGANIFRNSGLWYRDTTSNPNTSGFEYWDGTVNVKADSTSASGTKMLLQNGRVTQNVSDLVSGGEYTIGFKYTQLEALASMHVYVGDNDYSQYMENGVFRATFNVSGPAIDFTLECDVDNGFEVYELMGNRGSEPLVWSQFANEFRTDTVNISKGITITSSVSGGDIYFKADYDGIRIINQSNNDPTTFTDKGTETENLVVRNQAQVSGALHTKVGNQTWINGLL
jgi:hypothetical protein